MPSVGFEPTCVCACSLGKCVYQFHHDGIKRGSRESDPHGESLRLAGFRDRCCTSWARSTDTDGRIWTGTDFSSWVWASRVCHFATSAFYCTSRESNSAGMLRITMPKQRIVFIDTISARHCIHPIASYAFPISPSCNDPIGDRTRVYAVRASSFRSTMGPWGDHGESDPDEQIHNLPFYHWTMATVTPAKVYFYIQNRISNKMPENPVFKPFFYFVYKNYHVCKICKKISNTLIFFPCKIFYLRKISY